MITWDNSNSSLFVEFGKGSLILTGGVVEVEKPDMCKKLKAVGIDTNSFGTLPIGSTPEEKTSIVDSPIKLLFYSDAAIDNLILQLQKLKEFDLSTIKK